MKLTKTEVYFVEYWELEDLFLEHFPELENSTFEMMADLEADNNSLHKIDICPDDKGDPGLNVGDYDDEHSEITTFNLMVALGHREVIPYGTYIIEFCW